MNVCKGSGGMIPLNKLIVVHSYQSVDGLPHRFVNCPTCTKQLKAPHDFIVRHTPTEGI